MDERFYASLFPRRHRVLARWLAPYNLRHRAALKALGSPIVKPGAPITWPDLFLACRVCAQATPDLHDIKASWKERLLALRFHFSKAYRARQTTAFLAYIADHCALPRFWKEELHKEVPFDSGIQEELEIVCVLMRHGFTHEEAWTLPLALANFYYASFIIQRGARLQFLTTETERENLAFKQNFPPSRNAHAR